ncbi:MAG: O-antigen ligase family protein [Pyrinomonadaceae bacterium]|nr:O-antigen ligase family protein [Pyrinomonadaceae bacterium]
MIGNEAARDSGEAGNNLTEKDDVKSGAAKLVDAAIVGCLFVFVVFAPHSIAFTQGAWLLGTALWLVRFLFRPRPRLFRTPVDYLLLGFFILSGVSAFLSYEPTVSIGKLRAASLFTIIYLFAENVPSLRVARLLAITLICSCVFSVFYTGGERIIGRGVKVFGVSEQSPLYKVGVRDGDTLLTLDGTKLRDPQDLVDGLSRAENQPATIAGYRHELLPTFKVPRGSLLSGSTALEQLGVQSWSSGRDWRASGLYGQFVTYAEVLQLVIALALGLFVSLPLKRSWAGILLLVALAGFSFALLLTFTRAAWLGSFVSSLIVLILTIRRRTMLVMGLLAIPVILAGLFMLQQKRQVGFLDQKDDSTVWRTKVWREGARLLVSKPRHLLVGIGMDSIKKRWRQWGMFDGGRIPWGHMHSNLLQIALERGLPALLLWLGFLFVYARTLWRSVRSRTKRHWVERGILLGALGGLAGFLSSGLVHYNWGDSEVVMVFYLVMGLALVVARPSEGSASS